MPRGIPVTPPEGGYCARNIKRLEQGRFVFPPARDGAGVEVRATDLLLILAGVELESVRRQQRYQRPAAS